MIPGTSDLPGKTLPFLEVNTAVHAIAREHISAPPPAAAGGNFRQDLEFQVEVEPLALEVCLFDNGRRSSSPLAPPSSSALLGVGTVELTPIIVASGMSIKQGEDRSNSTREVLLFEPGSGRPIASALLGMSFSSHDSSCAPFPTESPRIVDASNACKGWMPKVRELSRGNSKPTQFAPDRIQVMAAVVRALDSNRPCIVA